jgi:hypothetical protein
MSGSASLLTLIVLGWLAMIARRKGPSRVLGAGIALCAPLALAALEAARQQRPSRLISAVS